MGDSLYSIPFPNEDMVLKPDDYDFGNVENYSFVNEITCNNDETRKVFILAYGHMLNYNHEEAIACFQDVQN